MLKDIKNGVYPTMVTPYTKDNKIDYGAVEQLLQWYGERGVAGVFAICQSSEIFYLSFEERLELLRFVMKHRPAGMEIVASGHVENNIDRETYEAKAFIDEGIDAYVFISNRFAEKEESDDIFLKNMEAVISSLPEIGLGIYECPYPYKRVLSPYVMSELAKTGRFQFLKDTCCDLNMIKAKLDAVSGSAFKLFNANAATLLESLKMGCAGYSGVMANFHPEIYAELCNIYNTDREKAKRLQDFVGFFSVAECQMYPVNAKYYLTLEGLDMNIFCRSRDCTEFTENRRMEIEQMRELTILYKSML